MNWKTIERLLPLTVAGVMGGSCLYWASRAPDVMDFCYLRTCATIWFAAGVLMIFLLGELHRD